MFNVKIFQSNNKYQLSEIQKNPSISLDSQTKETSTRNHFIKFETSRASIISNYVANW